LKREGYLSDAAIFDLEASKSDKDVWHLCDQMRLLCHEPYEGGDVRSRDMIGDFDGRVRP
jgi:hypothetical protein